MNNDKSFLARNSTRIYLESYMLVMFIIFLFPNIYMLIARKNAEFFGANILFFEFNMFLSFVLMIYTYFTRDENRNWKVFIGYFLLSFVCLIASMLLLGGDLYF